MMEFKEKVGSRLKEVREALGFSTTDVAKRVSFSYMALHSMERAKTNPSFSNVSELCEFYDILLDTLAYGSDREFEILLGDLRGEVLDEATLQKQMQELKHLYLG